MSSGHLLCADRSGAEKENQVTTNDKTRKSDGGTGLGLAISKIIIDKHKGKIFYKRVNELNIFEIDL